MTTLGSQRLLQIAVTKIPELLRLALKKSGALRPRETVEWKSPLQGDAYKEYRDSEALKLLGLPASQLEALLKMFWAARGPVWDGLAVTSNSRPLILEAKAHIPEAASSCTKASPASLTPIEESLAETRKHLAPKAKTSWTGTFCQYANRLAFQYYLKVLNRQGSVLVFLDFTNAADMDGPSTEEE